jgi:formylglycine-generating enzyme
MKNRVLALVVLLAVVGCGDDRGSFTISFSWEQQPDKPVWLWVRVEERSDAQKPGPILASAGPELYDPDEGISLTLPEVANGDNRNVIVDVREGNSTGMPVLYYGISEPFSIRSGGHTAVNVFLTLARPEPDKHGATVEIRVDGNDGGTIGPSQFGRVTVFTRSCGAHSVVLANDAAFSANLTTVPFTGNGDRDANCQVVDEDGVSWNECEIPGWNLGVGTGEPADGAYSVYARFIDEFGYESQVYKASVVLDMLSPQAMLASLSKTVVPAGGTVYLTVSFHEALEQEVGAELEVLPAGDSNPVFVGPVRVGSSTSYTWTAVIDPTKLVSEAQFTFSVVATDEYGNTSTEAITLIDGDGKILELNVDPVEPVLVAPDSIALSHELVGFGNDGEEFTFDFQIMEALPTDDVVAGLCLDLCPSVRLGGQTPGIVERIEDGEGENQWGFRYHYTIDAGDWSGSDLNHEIVIEWQDAAGNPMQETLPVFPRFDFRRPTAGYCALTPATGNSLTTFQYTVTVSEPLQNEPQLIVDASVPELFGEPPAVTSDGLTYAWVQEAQSPDHSFSLQAILVDVAGNESDGPVCQKSGLADVTLPQVEGSVWVVPDVSGSSGNPAVADGGVIHAQVVVTDSNLSEEVPPQVVLVAQSKQIEFALDSVQIGVSQPPEVPPWTYDYSLSIDAAEMLADQGVWPVLVTATDTAGNPTVVSNFADVLVQVDFEPPTAVCNLVPGAFEDGIGFPIGQQLVLQVWPSEPLSGGGPPVVIEQSDLQLPGAMFTLLPDTEYYFSGMVPEGAGTGDVTIAVQLADLLGNATVDAGTACISGPMTISMDSDAPVIVGSAVTAALEQNQVDPSGPLKAEVEVSVTVDVSGESLPPEVVLGMQSMSQTGNDGPVVLEDGMFRWSYQRTLDGSEGQGAQALAVTVSDAAGNSDKYTHPAEFYLDFSPPSLLNASLFLTAPEDAVSQKVNAITSGTSVELIVTASEALAGPPKLSVEKDGQHLDLGPWQQVGQQQEVTFSYLITMPELPPSDMLQGPWDVVFTLVDLAGNTAVEVAALQQPFVIDTQDPGKVDPIPGGVESATRLYRNQYGSAETELEPLIQVRGCPLPGTGGAWDWCPDNPELYGAEPSGSIAIYAIATVDGAPQCTDLLLGMVGADVDGGFTLDLASDQTGVCVSQVDGAGNLSAKTPVRIVEWVGSLGPPEYGTSPHRLRKMATWKTDNWLRLGTDAFEPTTKSERVDVSLPGDGKSVHFNGNAGWMDMTPSGIKFDRENGSCTYDSWRGRLVLFAGGGETVSDDLFEWDGARWHESSVYPRPSSRAGAALAYDTQRGMVVLFGGDTAANGGAKLVNDTWTYDGESWEQSFPVSAPTPRKNAHMKYDPRRGRVVLYGGDDGGEGADDMWVWDGATWNQLAPETWHCNEDWKCPDECPESNPLCAAGYVGVDCNADEYAPGWSQVSDEQLAIYQPVLTGFALEEGRSLAYYPVTQSIIQWINGQYKWRAWDGVNWVPAYHEYYKSSQFKMPGKTLLDAPRGLVWSSGSDLLALIARYEWWSYNNPSNPKLYQSWGTFVYEASTPTLENSGIPSNFPGFPLHSMLTDMPVTGLVLHYAFPCDQYEFAPTGNHWHRVRSLGGPVEVYAGAYDSRRERIVAAGLPSGTWIFSDGEWHWIDAISVISNQADFIPEDDAMLVYDSARDRVVYYGTGAPPKGTMEFDGTQWVDPGALVEAPPAALQTAYHPPTGTTMALGGPGVDAGDWRPGEQFASVWHYAPAHHKPWLVGRFDLTAANAGIPTTLDPAPKELLEVDITAVAGGTSHTFAANSISEQEKPGFQVWTWTGASGAWIRVHEDAQATPDNPSSFTGNFPAGYRCDGQDACLAPGIGRWIGPDGSLYVAVTPAGGHGSSDQPAAILLDHLEVRLVYARAPTCEAGTECCSLNGYWDDGAACDPSVAPCTQGAVCLAGVCGRPAECDDSDPCTIDSCLPGVGCQHAATAGECAPGKKRCNGIAWEICQLDEESGCYAYKKLQNCYDDSNSCTRDYCDPAVGCVHDPIAPECIEGQSRCRGDQVEECTLLNAEKPGKVSCWKWNGAGSCGEFSRCRQGGIQAECECLHQACENECCPPSSGDIFQWPEYKSGKDYTCFEGSCMLLEQGYGSSEDEGCSEYGCGPGMECKYNSKYDYYYCVEDPEAPWADTASPVWSACNWGSSEDGAMQRINSNSFWRGCNVWQDPYCGEDVLLEDFQGVNEYPPGWVSLDSYYIDKTEVTRNKYQQCVSAGACEVPESGVFCTYENDFVSWHPYELNYHSHPINCVTWNQAHDYCEWAGKRLCTEAEWEQGCRGAGGWLMPWGYDCLWENDWPDECADYTNYGGGEDALTSPVGAGIGGVCNLDNMADNVSEWVADMYGEHYFHYPDSWNNPLGPANGDPDMRVIKGGNWNDQSGSGFTKRCSYRGANQVNSQDTRTGFRCCKDIEPDDNP